MPEFYDAMYMIVKRMAAVKKRPGGYELLTDKGGRLGELETSVRGPISRILQGLSVIMPRKIEVRDSKGTVICVIRKIPGYGAGIQATVARPDGQRVAKVRVGKREMGLSGQKIEVVDPADKPVGSMVGDWRSWNIQIFDEQNGLVGKITKKSEHVNRVIYADDEHYAVELMRPIPNEGRRRVMLSVAASLELLMT